MKTQLDAPFATPTSTRRQRLSRRFSKGLRALRTAGRQATMSPARETFATRPGPARTAGFAFLEFGLLDRLVTPLTRHHE